MFLALKRCGLESISIFFFHIFFDLLVSLSLFLILCTIVRQITGIILVNLDLRYIENVLTDFDSSGPLLKETS